MEIKTNPNNKAELNWIYGAIESRIDDNALTIASTPAFQTFFYKFKASITANTKRQKSVVTDMALDKSTAKQTLPKLAANIVDTVYTYASINSNEILK